MFIKNIKISNRARGLIVVFLTIIIVAGVFLFKNLNQKPPFNPDDPNLAFETSGFDLEKLTSYKVPIFISLGAEHCPGCIQMNGMLKDLNRELMGKAIIKYVDLYKEENEQYYQKYLVKFLPTLLFYGKDGKPFVPDENSTLKMNHHRDPQTNEVLYSYMVGTLTKEQILNILYEMGMEK